MCQAIKSFFSEKHKSSLGKTERKSRKNYSRERLGERSDDIFIRQERPTLQKQGKEFWVVHRLIRKCKPKVPKCLLLLRAQGSGNANHPTCKPKILSAATAFSGARVRRSKAPDVHPNQQKFCSTYLIFLDDVWDIEAWNCLKASFPDDSSESRILLTSRHHHVAKLNEELLFLRQLTSYESWELMQKKVFPINDCPLASYELGLKIVENCKGLPLTVVIVAGLLSTTEQEVWKEVLQSSSSGIISISDQCKNTIELSYKHLPDDLKPCLLCFGAFPEDQEVSAKRLIWLWIAEGFVRRTNENSLEEVATDYLKNLISRSLVMVARQRSIGGVKACCTYDLLHEFCLRKAKEEKFLQLLKGYEELSSFNEPGNLRRLCIYSKPGHFKESKLFCPRLRSLLFFDPKAWNERRVDISFIFRAFKLLSVLDIEQMNLGFHFPSEIGLLVRLKYLAIRGTPDVSPSIGNLSNLETFILRSVGTSVILLDSFWNLQKLRHLYLRGVILLAVICRLIIFTTFDKRLKIHILS